MLPVCVRCGTPGNGVMIDKTDSLPTTPDSPDVAVLLPELHLFEADSVDDVGGFHGPYAPPPASLRQARRDWLARHEDEPWMGSLHEPQGGKMFGLLLVRRAGRLYYLVAYSGKLSGQWSLPGFVPPVFDVQEADRLLTEVDMHIGRLNSQIKKIENPVSYGPRTAELQSELTASENRIALFRLRNQRRKQIRAERRAACDCPQVLVSLDRESQRDRADLKRARKLETARVAALSAGMEASGQALKTLYQQRSQLSLNAQKKHFSAYWLLTAEGEQRPLLQLFAPELPPGGAGDCAAPKLLHYAHKHNLEPLALAEFWLGSSPAGEVRHHQRFYPPCRSRCAPVLRCMLPAGLGTEPDTPYSVQRPPVAFAATKPAPIAVLYEDADLLIVDKPDGVLSVPGKRNSVSVVDLTISSLSGGVATSLLPVHRLDMDTSGILVLAKTAGAHRALQKQFARRQVSKRYTAILDGDPGGTVESGGAEHHRRPAGQLEGRIALPLRVDLDDRPRQVVCWQYGKTAETHYRILQREAGRCRLEFTPLTGRTHQLRIHAAHSDGLGTPILGDPLYGSGDRDSSGGCDRMHLHASALEFTHPVTGITVRVVSSAPF